MTKILAMLLNWLGGGVLTSVLGHLEKRKALENDAEKMKTEVTQSEIRAALAVRQEQAAIIKMQLGHPVQWFPRFTIEMTVAVYIMAHVVDRIWVLSGEVRPLDPAEAAVVSIVISGMFLQATFGKR